MDIIKIGEKYCLHDCYINKIEEENSSLILFINNGIYKLENGIYSSKQSTKCKYMILIDGLIENKEYEHITATVFKKNKRKELNFDELVSLVQKNKFNVDIDFYSNFAKCIFLKGFLGNNEAEISITDIKDIQVVFENNHN